MIKQLEALFRKEQYHPTFLSLFINPYYFIRKGLMKGVKKYSPYMKGVMLDFGCGSKPYRHFFDVEKYIGIDVAVSGHDHTNEQIDVFFNGKAIPFENESFDSVLSTEVLEHVFDIDEILCELHRVMKVGGKILITVPFAWDEHETPYDFGRYTSFGIKYLLEKHGFETMHLDKSTNYVETIFQMWNAYVYQCILPTNKYLRVMLIPALIFPFTLIGAILSKMLPEDHGFYHNNIILARKKALPE